LIKVWEDALKNRAKKKFLIQTMSWP